VGRKQNENNLLTKDRPSALMGIWRRMDNAKKTTREVHQNEKMVLSRSRLLDPIEVTLMLLLCQGNVLCPRWRAASLVACALPASSRPVNKKNSSSINGDMAGYKHQKKKTIDPAK
jgi:hypothetical protein